LYQKITEMNLKKTILGVFIITIVAGFYQIPQIMNDLKYDNYLLYVPNEKPVSGEYPLMLFLHGMGERGTDLGLVKMHGPPSFLNKNSDFPFVVVSPQCPDNEYWAPEYLLQLLDTIEGQLPIDKNKIYVTGLSMGGYGTWALAQTAPERFAAIAPICGGSPYELEKIDVLKDLPIWAFHGAKDKVVLPSETKKLVERLQSLGSDVKFTLYHDAEHNSWTATYENQELYDWLLSKSKD
jgi:predicted peptidase